MAPSRDIIGLDSAAGFSAEEIGAKAAHLARLAAAGFPVPPGLVATPAALAMSAGVLRAALTSTVDEMFEDPTTEFAVRSSSLAEDLLDASFAGLYETFLGVPREGLADAVLRCVEAAASARVLAYQAGRTEAGGSGPGQMAVLVQQMVPATSAGVAFTANPVTGSRDETVITAVRGLGERLVSGDADGDEWVVGDTAVSCRREPEGAISREQALAIAELARRAKTAFGQPQDIEWAIGPTPQGQSGHGPLFLLQARPLTALPPTVEWEPPGPGLWTRNFRLGEWLPEPMTPLFASWLLPVLEEGYLQGMRATIGTAVPFRYAVVNGWYYNTTPRPSPAMLTRALAATRGRLVPTLFHALAQPFRNPAAADRALLADLYQQWRTNALPSYRQAVRAGEQRVHVADKDELIRIVERLGTAAGVQLWFLAVVGGAAWKMEDCLARFARTHLARLTEPDQPLADGVQILLRGLASDATTLEPAPHAVTSIDWYWPTTGENAQPQDDAAAAGTRERHRRLHAERAAAEQTCLRALDHSPRLQRRFRALLEVTRRYGRIREEQARDLTLAWPLLRECAHRLGAQLVETGTIGDGDDVFFLTLDDLAHTGSHHDAAARRRTLWEEQRRLTAPLTLGKPPRLIGDPVARAVRSARGDQPIPEGAIVGEPASVGRVSGPVHRIDGPSDFASFRKGEVLLARSTTPAWTPLFGRAAAVITDTGSMAAHASIVAREYGIPAVVGTGDATRRLTGGQTVTVDGTRGYILPATNPRHP